MSATLNAAVEGTTSHKADAISFLRLASSGDIRAAYDRLVGPNFRHHNPYYRGDAYALMVGMVDMETTYPEKTVHVERALEDGDLVAVHSRVRLGPTEAEAAVVHIFRFNRGRIVELWDIGQPVPADSPNENGMF